MSQLESVTIRYYEAEDGSVILYDPKVHETTRIVEPVLQEGLNWTLEPHCPFPLPRPRWEEKVYTLQQVTFGFTEATQAQIRRSPGLLERFIRFHARRRAQIRRQLAGAFA